MADVAMPVVSGNTRLAGVIGYPVRYSLSPAMHNAAYQAMGIDAVYVAMPVLEEHVEVAVRGVRAFDMLGVSVTIPLKASVVPFLDEVSFGASRLDAVNCIALKDNRLVGHNTDGAGFVTSLLDADFDPVDKKCVLFGAGGSARAVAAALSDAGAGEVVVVNRSTERAQEVLRFTGRVGRIGSVDDIGGTDLIVNATPVGMDGTFGGQIPFDAELINASHTVADLVYHPLQTPLLKAARERGAHAIPGTGMLLHQAAEQIRLWTGMDAPIDIMREAVDF